MRKGRKRSRKREREGTKEREKEREIKDTTSIDSRNLYYKEKIDICGITYNAG